MAAGPLPGKETTPLGDAGVPSLSTRRRSRGAVGCWWGSGQRPHTQNRPGPHEVPHLAESNSWSPRGHGLEALGWRVRPGLLEQRPLSWGPASELGLSHAWRAGRVQACAGGRAVLGRWAAGAPPGKGHFLNLRSQVALKGPCHVSVPLGTGQPYDTSVRCERDPVRELPGVASAVAAQPAEAVCSHSRVTGLGAPQGLGGLLRRDSPDETCRGGGQGSPQLQLPSSCNWLVPPFIPE